MSKFVYRSVRIVLRELIERPWVFITGFKGYGLVGYITTLYLAEMMNCKRSGVVLVRYMPEAVTIDEEGIVPPFEIHKCDLKEKEVVIMINHDLPHERERTVFAEAIARWIKELGFDEAVYIGGFDATFREGSEEYRWIATSHWKKRLEGPEMIRGLYVVGPLALLVLFSELNGIPAATLLPYAEPRRPDPRAAAVAVRLLNELYGFNVPIDRLLEEASRVEEMVAYLESQKREQPSGAERAYM